MIDGAAADESSAPPASKKSHQRTRGPPESGNGGYACGTLGTLLAGPAEVTLRRPPPLDRELTLEKTASGAVLRDGELEQCASPNKLYSQPRTQFVAGFVGESNFIPAEVVTGAGSRTVSALGTDFDFASMSRAHEAGWIFQ